MGIQRYYTVGAVAPDLRSLSALGERVSEQGLGTDSLIVLARRRDRELIGVTLPGARVEKVESGLSQMQWFEFASTFLAVTATSVLMGAIHLPTGIVVQTVLTLAAIVGLLIYHRRPQVKKKLLGMALPERLAEEWEERFSSGLGLVLVAVPEQKFDEVQEAFLLDESLQAPLAVDRRPVM